MHRGYSYKMAIAGERHIIKELLEQYKKLPCLWDQTHDLYNNKSVRQRGYERLLKTYRRREPSANVNDVKKKLDNMRTCYKRERVKILKARMNGEDYVPGLWYYKLYCFLDEGVTYEDESSSDKHLNSVLFEDEERVEVEEREEERDEELGIDEKKERGEEERVEEDYEEIDYLNSEEFNPLSNKKKNIIYLADADDTHDESKTYNIGTDNQSHLDTSIESFSKTVGLQLNDLQPLQRFIAEKLISDVIFYARLGELKRGTRLNIQNNEEQPSD